jgi:hypothetical protein
MLTSEAFRHQSCAWQNSDGCIGAGQQARIIGCRLNEGGELSSTLGGGMTRVCYVVVEKLAWSRGVFFEIATASL